jgi:hypothetical protein
MKEFKENGLLDGYFDPQQWPDSGGLLGRLLAQQQQQGQYHPAPDFDQAPSVPQPPAPMPTPMPANFGQTAVQDPRSQYAALAPFSAIATRCSQPSIPKLDKR